MVAEQFEQRTGIRHTTKISRATAFDDPTTYDNVLDAKVFPASDNRRLHAIIWIMDYEIPNTVKPV